MIWWYCEDKTQEQVWSDIDEEEVEILARIFIRRGEKSPAAAKMVRAVANGSDYVEALIITIPRTIKMVDKFQKAPRTVRRQAEKPQRRRTRRPA